ncbi:heme biosynthesis protein HemY [Rhabdaerophilum calidifontis]|uniref:heme biosynthesis protein HemY n=1 Tax=Rhabdaerophilum calidifontis TaxID=2604328 RepID=UPI001239A7C5|nr:heme biosynthesis HemY N-terminal domain-containing protein [Rhabdaerophilum calidifontis]
MIRLVLFLGVLLVLALGLAEVADTPGHVVLQVGDTEFRVSLITGIGVIAALTLALMVGWTLLRLLLRLPSLIGLANRMRRQARGQQAVGRGLIAVGTGDTRLAQRHAQEAERLLGHEPLALLLRAQAAQLAGDPRGAETAFRAMLERADTASLGLRGLYIEAMRKGDAAEALRLAEAALARAPDSAWPNEAMLGFRAASGDWKGAIAIVDQSVSRRLIGRAEGRRSRAILLAAAARAVVETSPDEALALALDALRAEPGLVPAAVVAARRLSARGDYARAARILETAWKTGPHPDLSEAYLGVRPGDSALDRLKRARTLRRLAPHARESRFAVARAALDAREFTDAREALESLALEKPTARACLMMAELEELESGNQGLVRAWLARASRAPRDPAWVADGVVADEWAPVSPVTGRIGAFEWRDPPQASETHLRARIDADRFDPAPAIPAAPAEAAVRSGIMPDPDPIPGQVPPEKGVPAKDMAGNSAAGATILEVEAPPAPDASPAETQPPAEMAEAPGPLPVFDPFRPVNADDPGPEPGPAPAKTGFRLFGG